LGSGPPGMDVANAALKGGSPQLALQIADNVLARNPGNEDALLTKGDALTTLGQPDEAAVIFSQVLSFDPGSVSANIGLGRIRLSTDPVGAEELFLEALKHEPRNDVALNDLGIARDLQGRHTDAQTAYRRALGINPEMSAAQVNLALSLAMTGQSHDAVGLLQPLANKPGATEQTRHDLAAVLTMSGDRDAAAKILSRDLPPEQVQQALAAFASAQPNAAATMLSPAQAPPPSAPSAPPPASPAPAATISAAPVQSNPPAPAQPGPPAPAQPPVAAPPPVPAPASIGVASASAPVVQPNPPAPAQPAVSAPPPVPGPANTSEAGSSGSIQVQLAGPVPSKSAAETKWERLTRAMPKEFDGRQPIMAEVEEHGHTVWRVRTGGFSDVNEASALCEQVRSIGTTCKLIQ